MKLTKIGILEGIVAALALGISGCSLSGSNSDSLYVDLSPLEDHGSRFALLNSSSSFIGLTASAPTTASGFACYAVNVTGPGIVDTSPNPDSDPMKNFYDTLNVPGTYCSYRGIVTPPLRLDSTGSTVAELHVPPGGVRLVQVVGVNDTLVCDSGVVDDPPGSTGGGNRFYEVGRAVLNDVFGDRSVDVNMNWPTNATDQAARVMDCGGGCALADYFDPAANSSASFSGSLTMYAQRIPAAAGKYIRSVDVNLTLAAADTVTATIYTSTAGATVPTTATSYSTSLTLPAGTSGAVGFDLRTNNGELYMQSGTDYWLVIGSTSSGTSWKYTTGVATDMAKYISPSWAALTGGHAFDFRVNECAN
jgi:hypothetical protein